MILFVNPRVTRPKNRRFPLSLMSVGAALPERIEWEIVDGNRPTVDAYDDVVAHVEGRADGPDPVRLIAMTVMPGPQLVSAVPLTKRLKARYPSLPIVWGGYFPSLYPKPVLNSPYVDWAVRGQGERTFGELLEVLDGDRDPKAVPGLAFVDGEDGGHHIGPEREWVGPDELPPPPYHKIPVDDYLHPTFLGRRSGVYQASIGCPYGCKFCGVISVLGRREKQETPATTAERLGWLVREHGMDGVHFYDNNFFLTEDHARELAGRIEPLGLSWWCEARIDALLRFSDETWRALRRAGLRMVFFGAESGSDEVLAKMNKNLTTEQTLEVAARTREHGIIPEFSFVLGGPDEPEREIENTLAFIRELKSINPAMELITYFYTPTPQRGDTYGGVDPLAGAPLDLEEWTRPEWVKWMTHEDPDVPWMTRRLKARVQDFELVLKSRFPSVHDRRTRGWGKALGRVLARPRWRAGRYDDPRLLRAVRRWARTEPDDEQAYGHLRPPAAEATPATAEATA
ncbi:MAG: B12-binding domain-containing radical SAM protein [Gemmatimonadota bacterium]